MQIEQLQYLVEIERTGSISAAAHNLHVSQSAISKSLTRIEKYLGLPVFTRLPSGTIPTETGAQLIDKAKGVLNKLQELNELAEEFRHTGSGKKMTLACIPMFLPMLSEALEILAVSHPHTRIDIAEKSSKEILWDVRNHVIDLGFMVVNNDIKADSQLYCKALLETDAFVCVNKNSPLASRKYLHPEDVIDQKIAIYNGSMFDWFNIYFNGNESIQYSFVTNNLQSIKRKISQGSVISILSELTIQHQGILESGDIVTIPFVLENRNFKMQIASVQLKQTSSSAISKSLLKILESSFSNVI
jgi:LysR family transcriptional activator of glutamate synthase operon